MFFLDTYVPFVELDTIISDGYYGTYQLTNYLIGLGHRKIGFVGSVDSTSSIADRYWGYRRSLRENGIAFKEEWEIPDRGDYGKTFDKILSSPSGFDAYVCNSDYTVHILIQNLEEAGYKVPDDVSVVGFDNFLPAGMDGGRITSQIITGKIIEKQTVKNRVKLS